MFERIQALRDQNLSSSEDFENARASFQAARVRFVSAMARLKVLERGSGESIQAGEFTLTEEEQRLVDREAGEVIGSMTIRAPIAGIVLSRDTDPGAAVIPMSSAFGGTVLMVIADNTAMHFEGEVDEADIARVHTGMPARINVVSYPDSTFAGVVELISPLGVEEANVVRFEVHAQINEGQELLRAGMSADAELILEERLNVLSLQEAAIIYEEEGVFVQIRDETLEAGFRRIPVTVGISDGIKTEILDGLSEGDVVIIPES
jgi:HlyD family secretion protein